METPPCTALSTAATFFPECASGRMILGSPPSPLASASSFSYTTQRVIFAYDPKIYLRIRPKGLSSYTTQRFIFVYDPHDHLRMRPKGLSSYTTQPFIFVYDTNFFLRIRPKRLSSYTTQTYIFVYDPHVYPRIQPQGLFSYTVYVCRYRTLLASRPPSDAPPNLHRAK